MTATVDERRRNRPTIQDPAIYFWWTKLEGLWGGEIPEALRAEAMRSYELDDTPVEACEILMALNGGASHAQ